MGFIRFEWVNDDRNDNILFEKTFSNKKSKKDFILDWEKHIGWKSNPFVDEVMSPVKDFISGFTEERKDINLFLIEGRRFGVIGGKSGSGKTTLVRWIDENLQKNKGDYFVCYLDCKELKFEDFLKAIAKKFLPSFKKSLLKNIDKKKIFDLIKKKSKKIIFLVDDFHELSKENASFLKDIFKTSKIQMILSINYDENKSIDISDFGDDSLRIKLFKMDNEGIRAMIKKRIEFVGGIDIEPLNEVSLKTIAKKSGFNPREILSLCNKKAIEVSIGTVESQEEPEEDILSEDMGELEKDLAFQSSEHSVDVEEEEQKPIEDVDVVHEGDKIVQEILGKKKKPKKKKK